MKYINENTINRLLSTKTALSREEITAILDKSKKLQRLSLEETAALLAVSDDDALDMIFKAAAYVKDTIYGKRVVMFAPLYISNFCANNCVYCSFRTDNHDVQRKALSMQEIQAQVEWLLKRGHKRILLVTGESAPSNVSFMTYLGDAIKAIYNAEYRGHKIKRVNVNCAPLTKDDFMLLKKTGIGTYQLFQETYHDKTYRKVHPSGPKHDPDRRLEAIDRAFQAGIDDLGMGVLYGLYDYRFETLALLMHIEYLEKQYGVGPHTISVPRIEHACGADFTDNVPYPLTDRDFKKIVAVLRLSVPYTGIILSTREAPQMRDELLHLGVSQVSAESRTSPGGYVKDDTNTQFSVNDHRSLEQVIHDMMNHGYLPSFCAACYRAERTGKTFMDLAKPGMIKGKCEINCLATLKEYLDDFASPETKKKGYELIQKNTAALDNTDREMVEKIYKNIDKGTRDEFV